MTSQSRWSIVSCIMICMLVFIATPERTASGNGDPAILDAFGEMDEFSIGYIDGTVDADYTSVCFWLDGTPTSATIYPDGTFELSTWMNSGIHDLQITDSYGTSELVTLYIY